MRVMEVVTEARVMKVELPADALEAGIRTFAAGVGWGARGPGAEEDDPRPVPRAAMGARVPSTEHRGPRRRQRPRLSLPAPTCRPQAASGSAPSTCSRRWRRGASTRERAPRSRCSGRSRRASRRSARWRCSRCEAQRGVAGRGRACVTRHRGAASVNAAHPHPLPTSPPGHAGVGAQRAVGRAQPGEDGRRGRAPPRGRWRGPADRRGLVQRSLRAPFTCTLVRTNPRRRVGSPCLCACARRRRPHQPLAPHTHPAIPPTHPSHPTTHPPSVPPAMHTLNLTHHPRPASAAPPPQVVRTCATGGRLESALQLLEAMTDEAMRAAVAGDALPVDASTYNAVANACLRAGLAGKAEEVGVRFEGCRCWRAGRSPRAPGFDRPYDGPTRVLACCAHPAGHRLAGSVNISFPAHVQPCPSLFAFRTLTGCLTPPSARRLTAPFPASL
jgi:hypothetical protein